MPIHRLVPIALFVAAAQAPAQVPATDTVATHAVATSPDSTATDQQEEEGRPGMQYGVATNVYGYTGGASENALGAVVRWVPVQWLSLSATPSWARVATPRSGTIAATSRSGVTDLPLELAASHGFHTRFDPTVSASFGISLPTGDSAAGFGSGRLGYSASAGLGIVPTAGVWTHLGFGRSLSGISPASAFGAGAGWADLSAGTGLADRLEGSAGFSTDVGTVDPAIGRSSAISAGLSYSVSGPLTINAGAGHGLSGAAPSWTLSLGFGTAFPYLNHLGSGGAVSKGLGVGGGSGGGGPGIVRRGRP